MKKLFWDTAELDARAVSEFGLSAEILMQNAANALANAVRTRFKKCSKKRRKILGVVGSGNNGADVLAALRLLQDKFDCYAFLAGDKQNETSKTELTRALKCGVNLISNLRSKTAANFKIYAEPNLTPNPPNFKNLRKSLLTQIYFILSHARSKFT